MLSSPQAITVQDTSQEQSVARKLKFEDLIFKRRNYSYSSAEVCTTQMTLHSSRLSRL